MSRARYSAWVEGSVIVIYDLDMPGWKSVTNDVELVVQEIAQYHDLTLFRLVYRDSDGRWDGIAVKDNRFAGFIPLGLSDRDAAVAAARTKPEWRA